MASHNRDLYDFQLKLHDPFLHFCVFLVYFLFAYIFSNLHQLIWLLVSLAFYPIMPSLPAHFGLGQPLLAYRAFVRFFAFAVSFKCAATCYTRVLNLFIIYIIIIIDYNLLYYQYFVNLFFCCQRCPIPACRE